MPIKPNRPLRALLAVTLAVAVMAPYASPPDCRGGLCCGSEQSLDRGPHRGDMTEHAQHEHGAAQHPSHDGGDAVTDRSPADGCPMVMVCGTITAGPTVGSQATVPELPAVSDGNFKSIDFALGRLLSPLTPPPRV